LTRRDVLRSAWAAGPALGGVRARASMPTPRILTEPHLLSEESGVHFQQMLSGCQAVPHDLLIVPGIREMSAERAERLRSRTVGGAWVILESGLCFAGEGKRREQTGLWEKAFGLRFARSGRVSELFVEYAWPVRQIVRGFDVGTLLESAEGVIAWSGGKPVCCRRRLGRGGVIFLGSMLGPGLGACEREAELVGRELIEVIRDPVRSLTLPAPIRR